MRLNYVSLEGGSIRDARLAQIPVKPALGVFVQCYFEAVYPLINDVCVCVCWSCLSWEAFSSPEFPVHALSVTGTDKISAGVIGTTDLLNSEFSLCLNRATGLPSRP